MIRRRDWPPVPLLIAIGAFALLASCGDGGSDFTPPPTAVVSPPPSTLPPTSGGSGSSPCALGEGDENATCERTVSEMMPFIDAAIDRIVAEQPELFDLNVESGEFTGQYKVLDKEGYLDGVVETLLEMGVCAQRSEFDYEIIQIKEDNELSEDYDIYLSDGHIRRGGASYRTSCTPAAFPLPRPDGAPPQGSGCGRPFPPPISRVKVKVHFRGSDYFTLNATPLVGHDQAYCAAIGYTDGRTLCPVRQEGDPERIACETWAVGRAEDTGRVGPTWALEDQYCTGPASGCQNAPDNQYLLWAYEDGRYSACAENQACGYLSFNRTDY
ncbi:MAG: hypothetical protein PVJ73_13105 [Acidobacteriota bacterium]|jgi:hypothetical protein